MMIQIRVLSNLPISSLNGAGLRVLNSYFSSKSYVLRGLFWENSQEKPPSELERQISVPIRKSSDVWKNISSLKSFFENNIQENELIIACPDSSTELFAMSLTPNKNKKIAYIMDDFLGAQLWKRNLLLKIVLSEYFKYTLRKFDEIWVISDFLKQRIEEDFGIKVHLVLPPLKPGPVIKPQAKYPIKKLLYVGSLKEAYNEPIKHIAELDLKSLGMTLDVYGASSGFNNLPSNELIEFKGAFDENQKIDLFKEYDLGIISYSFMEPTRQLMKNSFPSKLIDYLNSGLPVLYLGPQDIRIASLIKERHLGWCEHDINNFRDVFVKIKNAEPALLHSLKAPIEKFQNDYSFESYSKILYQQCMSLINS